MNFRVILVFCHFDKNPFVTNYSFSCSQNCLNIVDLKCTPTSFLFPLQLNKVTLKIAFFPQKSKVKMTPFCPKDRFPLYFEEYLFPVTNKIISSRSLDMAEPAHLLLSELYSVQCHCVRLSRRTACMSLRCALFFVKERINKRNRRQV